MSGTKAGGQEAFKTNTAKYGADFYKRIGRKGGAAKKTSPAGFAYLKSIGNLEAIREAGRIGGTISKPYSRMKAREQQK